MKFDHYNPAAMPELFHPELHTKTREYVVLRSSFFTRYRFPPDERIGWHGDLIRNPLRPKAHGMYATAAQAREWPYKMSSGDIVIGPG